MATNPDLTVTVSAGRTEVRVALDGELDFQTHGRLTEAVKPHAGRARTVVLDLSRLIFCDSAGLAAIIRIFKATASGGGLVLRDPTLRVMRLFEITGLDRVFTIAWS
jgi:anti-sigma B factor antagonist